MYCMPALPCWSVAMARPRAATACTFLQVFGSCCTNTDIPNSDMDLSLTGMLTLTPKNRHASRKPPRQIHLVRGLTTSWSCH